MSKKTPIPDDDLDSDLDELLKSEGDTTIKKKTPPSSSQKASVTAKKPEKGDDFYASLAAKAKAAGSSDNLSDISDADPKELLQDINVDALDASLFGSKKPGAGSASKVGASVSQKPPLTSAKDNSRRFEVERPPTRSGGQKQSDASPSAVKKKGSDDINFDDDEDDLLLGLDSPGSKRKKDLKSSDDGGRPGSAKSVLDDLLGRNLDNKSRPSSGEQKLSFDSLTYKKEPEGKDESLAFGSYVPSASNSRPSSKRSVRFDDSSGIGNRPSSSDKLRSTAPASFLESVVEKDDRNWLDIATGVPPSSTTKPKTDNRPSSEGQMRDKFMPKSDKDKTPQKSSEPPDWLGFSRIGSPDTTPREADRQGGIAKELGVLGNTIADVPKAETEMQGKQKALSSTTDGRMVHDADGDWLGIKKPSQASSKLKDPLDWLLADDTGDKDKKAKESSVDFIATKGRLDKSEDGYLDLGAEIKTGDKNVPNWLGTKSVSVDGQRTDFIGADVLSTAGRPGSQSLKLVTNVDDELFGISPKKRDVNSPLPWELGEPKTKKEKGIFSPGDGGSSALTHVAERPPGVNSADLELQNHMLQDQQMRFMQQQQQQQVELQKRFQAEQEKMQRQREEQMKALQHQQQQLLMSQSVMPRMPFTIGGSYGEDLETKIKHLESEKEFLENMMRTIKKQHQEEKDLLEDSYRKRLELNEDTYSKRLDRLKQENELMSYEILEKMKLLEKEKSELFSMQLKKQMDWELEKKREIDHLRETHRSAIEEIRNEHQVAIERVLKTKNLELDAVTNTRDHARTLESAIHKMEENALGLQELQTKVEFRHSNSLSEREMAARNRDESLKILQDRLERQQHENEVERARLQGLITRLEMQLTNQARELEEEKWKVQQERNSLKAAQQALEQERIHLMEVIQRDRVEIEKSKTKFLDNQQTTLNEQNKERIQLAEEKAQFNIMTKFKQEDEDRTSAKIARSEAEVASSLRTLTEEKSRMSLKNQELEMLEERLRKERSELESQKRQILVEKERLEQVALCVQEKSREIEEFVSEAARDKQESQRLYTSAKQTEQEQNQRLSKIQTNLQTLHGREKQIAEERLSLAKERAALENAKEAGLCSFCRNPVNSQFLQTPVQTAESARGLRPVSSEHRLALGQGPQYYYEPLQKIYTAIQMDRSIRMWKIAADKDKEFLEDEQYYLEAVKHTPYHVEKEMS